MAVSPRSFTGRQFAAIAVLASVSFAGWQVWSSQDVAVVAAAQPAKETPSPKQKPIDTKDHERPDVLLTSMVQQLHTEAFQHFINSPGFGASRMWPTIKVMPREWKMPEWTTEELAKEQPSLKGEKDLPLIHGLTLLRFGGSKTPQERAAELAKRPTKKSQLWEIKSVDLVGLVMQEEPVVYVSEKIPDMKDLKNRPTREMDLFESEGLGELMNGKALYVRTKADTIRVLGPIHASKACLKCHGDAKEGTMLGMFSYTLRAGQYQSNIRGLPNGGLEPGLPGGGGKVTPKQ